MNFIWIIYVTWFGIHYSIFLLSWCTSRDPQYPTYIVPITLRKYKIIRYLSSRRDVFQKIFNFGFIFSRRTFVRSSHFVIPSFLHPNSILSQVDYAGSPCSSSSPGGGGGGLVGMAPETSSTMFFQQQQQHHHHHEQNSGINSQPQQVSDLAPIDLDGCTTPTAFLHSHSLATTDQVAEDFFPWRGK